MNNKKRIIQIIVIVIAFAGAGFILYNGFFKSSPAAPIPVTVRSGTAATSDNILPYGDTLGFEKVLHVQGFVYHQIDYPGVNAQSDVGVPVTNLIIPPAQ